MPLPGFVRAVPMQIPRSLRRALCRSIRTLGSARRDQSMSHWVIIDEVGVPGKYQRLCPPSGMIRRQITAFAAGAGPPEKRIAIRRGLFMSIFRSVNQL